MRSDGVPGVHIEELPAFLPSVTPVATAVPVFIGYTECARGMQQEDLTRTPVRIASLVVYKQNTASPVVGRVWSSDVCSAQLVKAGAAQWSAWSSAGWVT